jgi:hypothetical protein
MVGMVDVTVHPTVRVGRRGRLIPGPIVDHKRAISEQAIEDGAAEMFGSEHTYAELYCENCGFNVDAWQLRCALADDAETSR